jgi:RNA polymerase primary sigma factor
MLRKSQISAADISKEVEEKSWKRMKKMFKTRILTVIEEIRNSSLKLETLLAELPRNLLLLREKTGEGDAELKAKMTDDLRSLRLKDRHIERIAQHLKELSGRVEKVKEEIAEIINDPEMTMQQITEICSKLLENDEEEKKILKKLSLSPDDIQRLEKRLKSVKKKLEKIEQESGFRAGELASEIRVLRNMAKENRKPPNRN